MANGQAAAFAATNEGKLLASQIKVNEAMEKFGAVMAGPVADAQVQVADGLTDLIEGYGKSSQAVEDSPDVLRTAFDAVMSAGTNLQGVTKTNIEQQQEQADAFREGGYAMDDAARAARQLTPPLGAVGDAFQEMADKALESTVATSKSTMEMVDDMTTEASRLLDEFFGPIHAEEDRQDARRALHAAQEDARNAKTKKEKRETARAVTAALEDEGRALVKLGDDQALSAEAVDKYEKDVKESYKSIGQKVPPQIQKVLDKLRTLAAVTATPFKVRVQQFNPKTGGGERNIDRGRAAGGPVSAGQLSRVNELGMEYFRPSVGGQVIPIRPGGQAAAGAAPQHQRPAGRTAPDAPTRSRSPDSCDAWPTSASSPGGTARIASRRRAGRPDLPGHRHPDDPGRHLPGGRRGAGRAADGPRLGLGRPGRPGSLGQGAGSRRPDDRAARLRRRIGRRRGRPALVVRDAAGADRAPCSTRPSPRASSPRRWRTARRRPSTRGRSRHRSGTRSSRRCSESRSNWSRSTPTGTSEAAPDGPLAGPRRRARLGRPQRVRGRRAGRWRRRPPGLSTAGVTGGAEPTWSDPDPIADGTAEWEVLPTAAADGVRERRPRPADDAEHPLLSAGSGKRSIRAGRADVADRRHGGRRRRYGPRWRLLGRARVRRLAARPARDVVRVRRDARRRGRQVDPAWPTAPARASSRSAASRPTRRPTSSRWKPLQGPLARAVRVVPVLVHGAGRLRPRLARRGGRRDAPLRRDRRAVVLGAGDLAGETFSIPWWPDCADPLTAGAKGVFDVKGGRKYRFYTVDEGETPPIILSFVEEYFAAADPWCSAFNNRRTYQSALQNSKRFLVQLLDGPHAGDYFHPHQDGVTEYLPSGSQGYKSGVVLSDVASTPGGVVAYLYAEGTDPARPVQPIPLMTVDFDSGFDSDANAWTASDALGGLSAKIGDYYLETIGKVLSTGVLDVVIGPDLDTWRL